MAADGAGGGSPTPGGASGTPSGRSGTPGGAAADAAGGVAWSQPDAARSADAIVEAVRATGLLSDEVAGSGPVLLMCSAGRDSHCLLDVAVRLRGAARVRVLHVDHGLRAGAAQDAEQMRARCAELGVEMVVRSAGPRGGADPRGAAEGHDDHEAQGAADGHGAGESSEGSDGGTSRPEPGRSAGSGNVHAWARAARQRLADEERRRVGAAVVATAHTRTDLAETAIARFATQPGRRALLSMREQEEQLVRPLLGVTREETAAYCRARGITYRDDPSNADGRFSRARVRHGVLPILRSLNPQAEAAIARTLRELSEESEVIDALVDAELGGFASGVAPFDGRPSIRLARLTALPVPLARLVLRELCERTLGVPCARAASRLGDVLALASAAERAGLAAVDVGGGARIEVRGGTVRCVASTGLAAPDGG